MEDQGWIKLWHRDDVEGNEDIQSLIEKMTLIVTNPYHTANWGYINDVATFWFMTRSHRPTVKWFNIVDFVKEVARLLPKAYGEISFHNDEESEELSYLYQVYILQDGKLRHHIHPHLSLEFELRRDEYELYEKEDFMAGYD